MLPRHDHESEPDLPGSSIPCLFIARMSMRGKSSTVATRLVMKTPASVNIDSCNCNIAKTVAVIPKSLGNLGRPVVTHGCFMRMLELGQALGSRGCAVCACRTTFLRCRVTYSIDSDSFVSP